MAQLIRLQEHKAVAKARLIVVVRTRRESPDFHMRVSPLFTSTLLFENIKTFCTLLKTSILRDQVYFIKYSY